MRVSEVMSARPIVVSSGSRREAVRRLMESAEVHHVPVIDDGRVAGVWVATAEGPLILLGPEHVDQTFLHADAEESMTSLIEDSETVLVWDSGVPAGILTPSDLRNLVREALQHQLGNRYGRPVVALLCGPAQAGKTTLLTRTLSRLPSLEIGVVQGNAKDEGPVVELLGARSVDAPQAHWRSGLKRAAKRLTGAQLILVEDLDGPVDPVVNAGEDLKVIVLDARQITTYDPSWIETASAVAICRADQGDPAEIQDAVTALRERCPYLPVFVLAPGHDDRGMREWSDWLEGEVRERSEKARGAKARA